MRAGYIFSAILHAIFAIVIIFGLPSLFSKKNIEDSAIVVEILPVSEFTNVKPRKKMPPTEKPVKKASVAEKIKPALPDPTIKPKPEMSKPESSPKAVVKPKVEEKVAQADLKPIPKPVKAEEKPKNEKPKEEKPEDAFGAVLNTVEKIEAEQPKEGEKKEEVKFSDIEDMLAGQDDQPQYKPGLPLSMSEKDAIKKQIMENWTVLSGGKDAKDMLVTLDISLLPDGTIKNIEIENKVRYNTDSFYRAMVDSAIRAVYKSSPLKNLPAEKYAVKDGWRDMEINFDPSEMMY